MRVTTKIIAAALGMALLGGAAQAAPVVVSSKIDTEGGVLGNIILSVLNANNIETTSRVQLGGTDRRPDRAGAAAQVEHDRR